MFEIAGQRGGGKVGLAGEGGEDVEVGEEHTLSVDEVDLGLLGFDLGLEDVGGICLADVAKLVGGGGGVLGKAEQSLAEDDGGLRGKGAVEGLVEVVADAEMLLRRGETVAGGLLAVDVAAEAELAAEDDGLREEGSLLAAAVLAAADVFAGVADRGVWWQAGLAGLARRSADEGIGFSECGIGVVGPGFKPGEGERGASGDVVEELGRGEVQAGVELRVFGFLEGEGVVGDRLGVAGRAGRGGLLALLLLGVLEAAGLGVGGFVGRGWRGRVFRQLQVGAGFRGRFQRAWFVGRASGSGRAGHRHAGHAVVLRVEVEGEHGAQGGEREGMSAMRHRRSVSFAG